MITLSVVVIAVSFAVIVGFAFGIIELICETEQDYRDREGK